MLYGPTQPAVPTCLGSTLWRDNDTPSNSRPPSGASTRSQHQETQGQGQQRDDRPASGSSTGSKRSTGGGYGAGGLVALPVNRSVRDINRSQRRVRSREGRVPGGKHGEYWRSTSKGKPPAAAAAAAATATTGAGDGTTSKGGNAAGLGMAAIAAASATAAAG